MNPAARARDPLERHFLRSSSITVLATGKDNELVPILGVQCTNKLKIVRYKIPKTVPVVAIAIQNLPVVTDDVIMTIL